MITNLYPNYEWGHHDLNVLGSNPLCTLAFDRCFMRKHTLFNLRLYRKLVPHFRVRREALGIMGVVVFLPNVRPSIHYQLYNNRECLNQCEQLQPH